MVFSGILQQEKRKDNLKKYILQVKNVSKSYNSFLALDDVSFKINPGEHIALLGPNGAGKTTLFSLLSGLFVSEKGSIIINDFNMHDNIIGALANIGVVFQQPTVDSDLMVKDNLIFHSKLHGLDKNIYEKKIDKELIQVKLSHKKNSKTGSLSGGEKRKVELARSLIHDPKLLLMDEPTVGLDPQSRSDLLNYIVKIKNDRKMAVLWATHLVDEAEVADKIIILNKGKIIKQGTPLEITTKAKKSNLHDAFLELIKEHNDD